MRLVSGGPDSARPQAGVAVAYFSAVGSTKLAAELLSELLLREAGPEAAPTLVDIEGDGARAAVERSRFVVLCYPTYYLKPAPPMADFVAELGPFDPARPCYLITTCELYSENGARRLAKLALARGLIPVGRRALRATGSDVTAVAPAALTPWLFRFGPRFESGLRAAAREIAAALRDAEPAAGRPRAALPLPRWYTPLTQLLQFVALNHFDAVKYRLRVDASRCTACGLCVARCPAGAFSEAAGAPRFEPARCLLCCRCIHACPERAIALFEGLKDNRRIDAALLARLEADARRRLGLPSRAAPAAGN